MKIRALEMVEELRTQKANKHKVQALQVNVQPKADAAKLAANKKKGEEKAREKELNERHKFFDDMARKHPYNKLADRKGHEGWMKRDGVLRTTLDKGCGKLGDNMEMAAILSC